MTSRDGAADCGRPHLEPGGSEEVSAAGNTIIPVHARQSMPLTPGAKRWSLPQRPQRTV